MADTNLAQLLEKILGRLGFPTESEGNWAKKLVAAVDTEMKALFEAHQTAPEPTPPVGGEPAPGPGAVPGNPLPPDDTTGQALSAPEDPVPTVFAGAPTTLPAPETPSP